MDLQPSEEQRMIVDTVRRFVREKIVPLELDLDPDASELEPDDHARLVAMTKEMGLYGLDMASVVLMVALKWVELWLVLALTYLGGEAAQITLGVSDKVARVFQGLLLFLVLAFDTLVNYQVRWVGRAERSAAAGDS